MDPTADLTQFQSDNVKVATVVGGGGAKDMVKDSLYLNKQYLEDLNSNTISWVQVTLYTYTYTYICI